MMQDDDFWVISGFFPDKKYINLSSKEDMRVESMVFWKYDRCPTNTKLNAKSGSIPLNFNGIKLKSAFQHMELKWVNQDQLC